MILTRRRSIRTVVVLVGLLALSSSLSAHPRWHRHRRSRPAVIVTVKSRAPASGTFVTPVWMGFHDGSFDIYDRGAMASDGLERIAEDGNTGPLSADFEVSMPGGVQATVISAGAIPPFGPGDTGSQLFEIDPELHRYFSYAAMVIPSNDAFIANDSPTAHPLFDDRGRFAARRFTVPGGGVSDAGTELNDEVPENTAFLGQMTPDTGVTTEEAIGAHPGFLPVGSGGILDEPMFAAADFLAPGYDMVDVRFEYVDLARPILLSSRLSAEQEVQDPPVESNGKGRAHFLVLADHGTIAVLVKFRKLSGPLTGAHLHMAPAGANGPIVVNLTDNILVERRGRGAILATVRADDVVGPLADLEEPFDAFVARLLTGRIYVNLHTEATRAGEIRGQVGG